MGDVYIALQNQNYRVVCTEEFQNKLIEYNCSLKTILNDLRKAEDDIAKMKIGEPAFVVGRQFGVEIEKGDNEIKLIHLVNDIV